MDKVKEYLRHNKAFVIACVVAIGLGIYLFGCEAQTTSPFSGQKVTRVELDNEISDYINKTKVAYSDLERQELLRQKISEIGLAYAQGGAINPIGAITTLLGIAGVGAVASYGKKDSLIKTLQNTGKETTNA